MINEREDKNISRVKVNPNKMGKKRKKVFSKTPINQVSNNKNIAKIQNVKREFKVDNEKSIRLERMLKENNLLNLKEDPVP